MTPPAAPDASRALQEYRRRRDLSATPEPAPGTPAAGSGEPRFVIQRHDARALHFDLRLEHEGVLRSWAVPKGVPLREGVRRLAVETEDHPLEYLDFAGVIPEGQYGAGRMTVWDRGVYAPGLISETELKVTLAGRLLRGEYHLVRTAARPGRREWLVFRSRSGPAGPEDPAAAFRSLRPMLATSVEQPFDDPAWAFELKWDGYRTLALVTPDGTELRSRSGRDVGASYPALADLRRALLCQEAVLDGELVVLDAEGRASFQALQSGRGPVSYVVFDLLYRDGEWLIERSWEARRAALADVLAPEAPPRVRLSDHIEESGGALFDVAREHGLEGIVAKRRDSAYRPGRRSDDWRKIKIRQRAVVVIGGYTEGQGARRGRVGALLVGQPGADGLCYVGHVGSGISEDQARTLWERLGRAERAEAPFAVPPPSDDRTHWTAPEQRCVVSFAELTDQGRMRAPVFHGLTGDPPTPAAAPRPHEPPPAAPKPAALAADGEQIIADGERQVRLTNLGKVFWPGEGITKGQLLEHYLRVAPVLVPHLAGRAMILKRFPDGIEGDFFFQHNLPEGAPEWLRTAELSRSERPDSGVNRYVVVEDALGLLWVVNLGAIDLNPWQSRVETPDLPTHVLFDLDPAAGVPFARVVETALLVREAIEAVGLRGYPKTSGATGMHVFVPLRPGPTYASVRLFAQVVAEGLARARPDLVTTETRVAERGTRVYLDANQNGRGRSISSVYSVRPLPGAPVSTPLRWEEVVPGLDPRELSMRQVAARVAAEGDLFAGVLEDLQDLAPAVERLAPA